MRPFISEDDLDTFEGWLKYQAIDAATLTAEQLTMWRGYFEEAKQRGAATPKVGLMKLRSIPGEYRYAVALRDGSGLWLTLWIRRSPKGEFFVIIPRSDREWDPHTSYHLDGTVHSKSFNVRLPHVRKLQPLTGPFRGTAHLGAHAGHGPKGVGAECDPGAFNGVVEVPPGVLGPSHGMVVVDLVEPEHEPLEWPFKGPVQQKVFCDFVPWVVIRIGSS
jgi:hypothetical protein